jgi:hypothetical protein
LPHFIRSSFSGSHHKALQHRGFAWLGCAQRSTASFISPLETLSLPQHQGVVLLKRYHYIMSSNPRKILWTCLASLGKSTLEIYDNQTNHLQWPAQRLRLLAFVHLQTCASSSTYPQIQHHLEVEMSSSRSQPRAPTNG